ncbi:MAG: glycosyltransferase family 4 protein [Bdellovibrionales bacterium]|nr:glycosyltransferase family 4 protein [Bdellovibrionales bacterium]
MNIAFYHNLPSGGAKRAVFEMIRGLSKRGHRIWEYAPKTESAERNFMSLSDYCEKSIFFDSHQLQPVERWIPLITPYLNLAILIANFTRIDRMSRYAAKVIDAHEPDVVFVHDCMIAGPPHILPYLHSATVYYCHHGLRTYSQLTQTEKKNHKSVGHSSFGHVKSQYYTQAGRIGDFFRLQTEHRNIRAADYVWTNSCHSRERIYAMHGVDSKVVRLGVDTDRFRPLNLPRADYLLAVGGLQPFKGYRFLLGSLARIPRSQRPHLIIAANAEDSDYRGEIIEMAKHLNVSMEIRKIWNDDVLVDLYNRAIVLVYTPVMEALGLAALEAMACGTAVVAVREGGIRETVVEGRTGILSDRDENEFAAALVSAINNKDLIQEMGKAGSIEVQQHWQWDGAIEHIERALERVVAGSK